MTLESSYALLLESAKILQICNKKIYFFAKSSDIGKKFAKKNVQKVIKYTFLKILDHDILNMQKN